MTPPLFVTFTQNYYIRTGRQRTLDFLNEKRNQVLKMVTAVNASPWQPLTPEASTTLHANSWTNSPNIVVAPLGTDPLTNDRIYRASIPITSPSLFLRLSGAATP